MKIDNQLLSTHLAMSLAKQEALANFLGDHNWEADLDLGTVDFGDGRVFPIQLLGTEAEGPGTWLWAWANTSSQFPETVLQAASQLHELGLKEGIAFLVEPETPLEDVSGHPVGLIASGLCNADAYYRGTYDGGAAVFLIYETPFGASPALATVQVATTLTNAISLYDVDHRQLAESFLSQLGLSYELDSKQITAQSSDGNVQIGFDELGRISHIETEVRGS